MVKKQWIIGIDEVGRGPLAGPVTICAVAIPGPLYKKLKWNGLTDSKQMTALARERWYVHALELQKKETIRFALSSRSANAIDQQGIAVCIRSCIESVLKRLELDPKHCRVLLDGGLKAPAQYLSQETIIRGDSKEKAISLASVIAKVSRDRVMNRYHKQYPLYVWDTNKGYGTKAHRNAIKAHKTTPLHRISFLCRILDK